MPNGTTITLYPLHKLTVVIDIIDIKQSPQKIESVSDKICLHFSV